ncbi:alanyl-tRNA synthetase [Hypnocyclicus thermotrophus]|uniref:Alanyl-tRNA synthetase n=1 Tax=Hypnocyclicus thermotrophus TaxID=1627895 RepID=A0AA46I5W7_9FUSO|nr:alanyl-tRNA editing protein [Hypnocyclicus thermotrophus]TDT71787.1 alanyl-tRNA synthetase [Hypnocyclicus thermotrophus]
MKINIININQDNNFYKIKVKNNHLYPDGKGGQLGDRGKIADANIVSVTKNYILIDKFLNPGEYEFIEDINWKKDISIQHSAEHLFAATVLKELNLYIDSVTMNEDYSYLDIPKTLKQDELDILENKVNKIISKNLEITEIFTNINDLKNYNTRTKLKVAITDNIRLIKIGDYDIVPCGGYHVNNTSEIKIFKIINFEKVKGGKTRVYFLAGDRAFKYFNNLINIIKFANNQLSSQSFEINEKIIDLKNNIKSLKNENNNLKNEIIELKLSHELSKKIFFNDYQLIIINKAINNINPFLKKYILNNYILISSENNNFTIFSDNFNCKSLFDVIKSKYNIKGGGNNNRINFSSSELNIELVLNILKEII